MIGAGWYGGMVWGFPISCLCTYLVEKLIQILRSNIVSDYADDIRCGFDIVDIFYIYIYTLTHTSIYTIDLAVFCCGFICNFCLWISFIYVLFMGTSCVELPMQRDTISIYILYIYYIIYIRVFLACLLCAALSRIETALHAFAWRFSFYSSQMISLSLSICRGRGWGSLFHNLQKILSVELNYFSI